MSDRLFVRPHIFWSSDFCLREPVAKFQIWLKSGKNIGRFTWRQVRFVNHDRRAVEWNTIIRLLG